MSELLCLACSSDTDPNMLWTINGWMIVSIISLSYISEHPFEELFKLNVFDIIVGRTKRKPLMVLKQEFRFHWPEVHRKISEQSDIKCGQKAFHRKKHPIIVSIPER